MRYVRILVVVLSVVVAALATTLFVLGWTPAGVHLAAQWLSQLSDGVVMIEGADGRLMGPLRAEAVEIRTTSLRVQLRDVVMEWRPQALRNGALHVVSLTIEEVAIAVTGDDQPSAPPLALQLPFPVRADDIAVGRVVMHRKLSLDDEPQLIVQPLRAGFDSDGRHHRIARLEMRREQLALTGDLSLQGVSPFALSGNFQVAWQHPEHAARLDLTAGGSLTAIALEGTVRRTADPPGTHEGRARARLAFWGTPWLQRLAVDWPHLDARVFDARFPRSDAHLVVEAAMRADGWLAGTATLDNAAAGPLDRGQWPLARLRTRFATDGQDLRLNNLVSTVGDREARGEVSLKSGVLAAHLDAPALVLSAIHSVASGEAGVRLRVAGNWRSPSGEMVLSSSQLAWTDRWRARGVSARLRAPGDGTVKLDAEAEHIGHSDFDWNPGVRLTASYGAGHAVVSGRIGDARGEIVATELRLQRGPQGETALSGRAHMRMASVDWLGPLISDDLVTSGRMQGEVALAGTLRAPLLEGAVTGEDLMLASKRSGMRLVRGNLELGFDGRRATLRRLHFADGADAAPPRRELAGIGAGGVEVTGEADWANRTLRLAVALDRVAVLQKKRQWMRLSGTADVGGNVSGLRLSGRVRADGGAITLVSRSRPQLSRDVIIGGDGAHDNKGIPATVDLDVDLGERFWFSGAGLDSRLVGALRFQSTPGNPVRATGTIRSEGGYFDAYGQRLAIARGILAFQGDLENPVLDVAAERVLPDVTVGVEVTGTAREPRVKLVSNPAMSDAEKLSWLVLGKDLADVQAGDSSILLAAGTALFSGGSDGNTLARIQQDLSLQVGWRTGTLGTSSVAPHSRVVDTGDSRARVGSDILTVSTQLASGVSLGYEQIVGTTENVVRLSWALTRVLSLEVRSGSANAVDLFYTFSFGR